MSTVKELGSFLKRERESSSGLLEALTGLRPPAER